MIYKKYSKLFLLLFLTFLFGFGSRPFINRAIRKVNRDIGTIFNKVKISSNGLYAIKKSSCSIQLVNKIPKGSIALVGHAYGSHNGSERRGNVSFSPQLKRFFNNNQNLLKIIIFSGDVLKEPSLRKWEKFFNFFNSEISLFIAPGNHDVGNYEDTSLRDVFNIVTDKYKIPNEYPFYFINEKSLFIIDDSNIKESNLGKIQEIILQYKGLDNIYIVRHHVLPSSLKKHANGLGMNPFLNDRYFTSLKFKDSARSLTFIYGDGGAFPSKERLVCVNIGNTRHIVNGLGEQPGDSLLIIKDDRIFSKEI